MTDLGNLHYEYESEESCRNEVVFHRADRGRKQSLSNKYVFVESKTQMIRAEAKCETILYIGKLNF